MTTKERNNKRKEVIEYYSKLEFSQESHSYKLEGQWLQSCTKIVSNYETPFNAKFHARRIAALPNESKKPEYADMCMQDLLDYWDAVRDNALSRGTRLHNDLENKVLSSDHKYSSEFKKPITKFFKSLVGKYKIIVPELRMYHQLLGVCGTCDVLAYNLETGKYCLFDYKQGKPIVKSIISNNKDVTKKLKKPFTKYPATNYYKYSIQLSIYAYILKHTIGIEIDEMYIVHFTLDDFTLHAAEKMPVELIFKQDKLKLK